MVGLLTANSLRSHWVQMEMGAGWLQERLHPIRGPGIDAADLPSPLSDFITVGYCEIARMLGLVDQLAEKLGLSTEASAEPKCRDQLEKICQNALDLLASDMVRWFSLPPVLSATRLHENRFEYQFQSLCEGLGIDVRSARDCTTATGFVTRDPDALPIWARDVWTVSKRAVNVMLSGSARLGEDEEDIPSGVLDARLIADMKRALSARKGRERLVRKWFEDATAWIEANPPIARRSHEGSGHSHPNV